MSASAAPLPHVRETVRALLLSTPAYGELDGSQRRKLAAAMVKVCQSAADLVQEELASEARAARPATRALARAQNAGDDFSGVAASKVAGTTRAILNAVSFRDFVTDLINSVFQAMISSSQQQMQSYVELLNNVSASLEGFAGKGFSDDGARAWLADQFPGSFALVDSGDEPDPDEPGAGTRMLELRPGASMPTEEALRAALGLGTDEAAPGGNPESLVPFARRMIARQRQAMLATMVMLGMQRIVVDSGRINASMRFHIDTHSAANAASGSTFDFRNTLSGSGSFGIGAWGASAQMQNTVGYVSTQKSQTSEEMNTDLELNSSVEINFKSDYLPLNRMASSSQASRIRENSLNPQAEAAIEARQKQQRQNDASSSSSLDTILKPSQPEYKPPPIPTTPDAEERKAKQSSPPGKEAKPEAAPKDSTTNAAKKDAGKAPQPNRPPKPGGK